MNKKERLCKMTEFPLRYVCLSHFSPAVSLGSRSWKKTIPSTVLFSSLLSPAPLMLLLRMFIDLRKSEGIWQPWGDSGESNRNGEASTGEMAIMESLTASVE